MQLMERQIAQGLVICPLFSAPGVTSDCCKLDWLHVMDQGAAADVEGQCIWFWIKYNLIGRSYKIRLQSLGPHR